MPTNPPHANSSNLGLAKQGESLHGRPAFCITLPSPRRTGDSHRAELRNKTAEGLWIGDLWARLTNQRLARRRGTAGRRRARQATATAGDSWSVGLGARLPRRDPPEGEGRSKKKGKKTGEKKVWT